MDTNVIVRYFVEDPVKVHSKFKGVFSFFPKVESGAVSVELPDLVVFEVFFVLTNIYKIPQVDAAQKLSDLIAFRGFLMQNKPLMTSCLQKLQKEKIDLVDAYLLSLAKQKGILAVYSFDKDLSKHGLQLADVK